MKSEIGNQQSDISSQTDRCSLSSDRCPLIAVLCAQCLLLFCSSLPAAVSFDGANDVIAIPYDANLNGPRPISVSAWIYVAGEHEGAAGSRIGAICDRFGLSANRGWSFYSSSQYTADGTNTISFYAQFATAGVLKSSTAQSVPQNVWVHVSVTWDGSVNASGITCYTNGVATGSFASSNGSGAWVPDTNCPVHLGNRLNTALTFNGQIGEVSVWTNVLTATEIFQLYAARSKRMPLQIRASNLVGYWPLDNGPDGSTISTVASVLDLSRSGKHGSPTNGPVWRPGLLSYP